MDPNLSSELLALATAAVLLVIVLVVSYMCIQLRHFRRPVPQCARDNFTNAGYAPTCGLGWPGRRCAVGQFWGPTTGPMPVIDFDDDGSPLCCRR